MSDPEDGSEGEEEEEEEEEEEGEESGGEDNEDNEAAEAEAKKARVMNDIDLLNSIFRYVDNVGHRMVAKQQYQATVDDVQAENEMLRASLDHLQRTVDNQQQEIARLSQGDDDNEEAEYAPPRYLIEFRTACLVTC
jgi:ABC-type Zn2+ transport system substrate-binding protein/surface adhesin